MLLHTCDVLNRVQQLHLVQEVCTSINEQLLCAFCLLCSFNFNVIDHAEAKMQCRA